VAVCPATSNVVDLTVTKTQTAFVNGQFVTETYFPHVRDKSKHRLDESGGHSYEVFCWAGAAEYPDGLKLYPKTSTQTPREYLMTNTNVRKPSETFLILDRDEGFGGTTNNWPERGDNHGEKGINLAFADAHVEFVDRRGMVLAMLKSRHPWPCNSGSLGPALAAVPGLQNSGGWSGKWWLQ
jgi:prepilin-type processing-associated H-X9-DG protein